MDYKVTQVDKLSRRLIANHQQSSQLGHFCLRKNSAGKTKSIKTHLFLWSILTNCFFALCRKITIVSTLHLFCSSFNCFALQLLFNFSSLWTLATSRSQTSRPTGAPPSPPRWSFRLVSFHTLL
jgi:hypothetical protein